MDRYASDVTLVMSLTQAAGNVREKSIGLNEWKV